MTEPVTARPAWHDMVQADDLPGDLQLVAQECGTDVAVALAEALGGMKIYIPQADKIFRPHKKAFIRANRAVPVSRLVILTGLSESTVRDLLREIDRDDRQGRIF